ncbi:MAG: thiamine pyrophosphate-dependent dehydrogenase E1 component subunit alpha [Magnetococcales bacterium]|nr:thiamine pyrophosphate-dependent dehydrogenase E1 component subunit alpha [Magnetococcales bacterium]
MDQTTDSALCERLYRSLYRIRRVEEEVARLYPTDKIKSPVHLSIGQEAPSVAVCDLLEPEDVVFGTYRGHALYLAKGGDLPAMVAELYGKVDGCARGKGGSMHLIDMQVHMMGTTAIVATHIPHAVGYAWALQRQGKSQRVICFLGDGSTEEGVFSESLNFAALKRVPILFVCENNGYAIHSHISARSAQSDIVQRISGYGIPSARVEDGDIFRMRDAARTALAAVRDPQGGPYFLEILTCRLKEHVGPKDDWHMGYRSRADIQALLANDPVDQLAARLQPESRQQIETAVEQEIERAFQYAEESPFPEQEELFQDVFA